MQMNVSGGAPPPSSLQIISNIITWLISLLALGVAFFALYLQRRDKRPRLRLEVERKRAYLETSETDEQGFFIVLETDVIEIRAANPTDRQINIVSTKFAPKTGEPILAPLHQAISDIPSHEMRLAIVPYDELINRLGYGLRSRIRGQFILTDAIGHKHKTKSFQ